MEETKSQTVESGYRSYLSPEYRSPAVVESKTVIVSENHSTLSKADRIISDILKKYQMEKIPEAHETHIKKSEQILENIPVRDIIAAKESQFLTSQNQVVETSKSPNVNFLSPLLSSAELGSKNNTLLYSNFLARDDIKTTDFLALNKTGEENSAQTAGFEKGGDAGDL